jgi:hypothetical protein
VRVCVPVAVVRFPRVCVCGCVCVSWRSSVFLRSPNDLTSGPDVVVDDEVASLGQMMSHQIPETLRHSWVPSMTKLACTDVFLPLNTSVLVIFEPLTQSTACLCSKSQLAVLAGCFGGEGGC